MDRFDHSVPPPPLPTGIQSIQTKNGATKRRLQTAAGPSKVRIAEDIRHEGELCANCQQLQYRIDARRHELQQLEIEEEFQKIILQNKTTEYENVKHILKSFVRPEVCRILEEHVEGVPHFQLQDILAEINQASVSSSIPSVMMILIEYLLKNSRNTPPPPLRTDDALLQSVANLTRRNLSIPNSSSAVLDALTGLLRNSSATSTPPQPKIELKITPTTINNGVNGIGQYNGQKVEDAAVTRVASGYMNEQVQRLRPMIPPSPVETHAAAGPSGYPNMSLPIPPPARNYYTQPYTVPYNANMPYYQNYRATTTPVYGPRTNIPAVAHTNAGVKESSPYIMGGRYLGPPQ